MDPAFPPPGLPEEVDLEAESSPAASLLGTKQGDVSVEGDESDDEGRIKGYNPFGRNLFDESPSPVLPPPE